MLFRFIGQYTHGRTSICMNGVTFEGREPSEVTADCAFRFENSVEFEAVGDEPAEAEKPKRGRPKKEAP